MSEFRFGQFLLRDIYFLLEEEEEEEYKGT